MTPTALLPDRRSLELLGVEPRVQAAPRPRSGMPAARAADSSSAWVASGLAYSRLSRTLAWKRYVSCVTNPITDPREARVRRGKCAPGIPSAPGSRAAAAVPSKSSGAIASSARETRKLCHKRGELSHHVLLIQVGKKSRDW